METGVLSAGCLSGIHGGVFFNHPRYFCKGHITDENDTEPGRLNSSKQSRIPDFQAIEFKSGRFHVDKTSRTWKLGN